MALTQSQVQARNWFAAKSILDRQIATVSADDIAALKATGILDTNGNYVPPVPTHLIVTFNQGS